MRGGFLRGFMIGSVVGTVSSMLIDPTSRKKAMSFVNQGSGLAHMTGRDLGVESWIERGRRLLNRDDQSADQRDGQSDETNRQSFENMMGNTDGKENINRRVAMLEKRLEELSQRGV